MEAFILGYIILISIAGGYVAWWLCKFHLNIKDWHTDKYSRLNNHLVKIEASINVKQDELTTSIRNSEKSIKTHISSENNAIKQMIMKQFSNQTIKLIENLDTDRRTLSNLVVMVQNLQSQTGIGIKENSNKIGELQNSITNVISDATNMTKAYIQHLSSNEQKQSEAILAEIDMIFRNVSDFNKTIDCHLKILEESNDKNTKRLENSIVSLSASSKLYAEKITTLCTQNLCTEKELHQNTKISLESMNSQLVEYIVHLKQIDTLYNNLQKLYDRILDEEENISKQESSLSTMVSRHSQIFEIISEMNNTSKEIFEFMKLYLIQSTLDNFKNNKENV